ncbi:uncharacterized protein BO97DRAFT_438321 [Aspergillus homomorphus CBS 101889]|uniref:DUF7624 domain-containing protein n=1 Tax=Aspergillus homomorphus (strain CBS 101889) TaxID=1450537 RepID=A0A395HIT6_ASPHC|nr:hypothetical protein BO97DRAFT_438321 [Aspergillus homomorphus CBS 101889]RAL07546.1 hypothetical protein BO97DRAFT_438321 [Aspergillus homomorphus CBS 101889]
MTAAPSTPFAGLSQAELKIQTANAHTKRFEARSDEDEPPQSVIHAPAGFGDFYLQPTHLVKTNAEKANGQVPCIDTFVPSGAMKTYTSNEAITPMAEADSPVSPPPLSTSIEPASDWSERATPRAQTRQEFEDPRMELCSRTVDIRADDVARGGTPWLSMSSVEGKSTLSDAGSKRLSKANLSDEGAENDALTTALAECWALCNSLATLSCLHSKFQKSHASTQDEAWTLCWRLCQELYVSQSGFPTSKVNTILDVCHGFCQSLFEARVKGDEVTDSILRVSFELSNHLYNTHDRNLPEAFRERTLEFYITLCHRLMKQKGLVSEIDSPLSACWSFAEMLFTIRQSKMGSKRPDEEVLGSAVQACWELCDVFRRGWAQRIDRDSDRGTPRPSQANFQQVIEHVNDSQSNGCDDILGQSRNPETPTTVFDDTATISPDEAPLQNIFVLGQSSIQAPHTAWSSNSSATSGQSQSSEQSSSTKTITTLSGELNLVIIKILVTKAAINSGYQRSGSQSFSSFVKSLSSDAFGSTPWQISLLKNYKRLVAFDPIFKGASSHARASAIDVAQAVRLVAHDGQYPWLPDLYRLVFGFHTDEALTRKEMILQI